MYVYSMSLGVIPRITEMALHRIVPYSIVYQCSVIAKSRLVNTVREQFAKVREQCSPTILLRIFGEHCS